MVDKQPPITIQVVCDSCLRSFEIRKANKPESYPCPKCKVSGVLHLA